MKNPILLAIGIAVIVLGVVANMTLFTVYETEQVLVLQFGEYKLVCARHPGSRRLVPGYG